MLNKKSVVAVVNVEAEMTNCATYDDRVSFLFIVFQTENVPCAQLHAGFHLFALLLSFPDITAITNLQVVRDYWRHNFLSGDVLCETSAQAPLCFCLGHNDTSSSIKLLMFVFSGVLKLFNAHKDSLSWRTQPGNTAWTNPGSLMELKWWALYMLCVRSIRLRGTSMECSPHIRLMTSSCCV